MEKIKYENYATIEEPNAVYRWVETDIVLSKGVTKILRKTRFRNTKLKIFRNTKLKNIVYLEISLTPTPTI